MPAGAPLYLRSCLMWLLLFLLSRSRETIGFISQTIPPRRVDINGLNLFFADETDPNGRTNGNTKPNKDQVPFVIERIGDNPSDFVFEEIAQMCIDVFFNDRPSPTPWKQVQLSYLRNLQQSDLYHRKTSRKFVNEMFVARRVLPVSSVGTKAALKKPIILDVDTIYNLSSNVDEEEDYVKDQVIGFVEVTEKAFGLGTPSQSGGGGSNNGKELRPVLTNLAVHPSFRKASVGSQLLRACEDIVAQKWKQHDEIVLEVEDDNPKALAFYSKRGYEVVFEDPASRRYDVNGFFLQKKQCTKICMRKALGGGRAGTSFLGSNLLQSLRESVFSKQ